MEPVHPPDKIPLGSHEPAVICRGEIFRKLVMQGTVLTSRINPGAMTKHDKYDCNNPQQVIVIKMLSFHYVSFHVRTIRASDTCS